MKEFILLGSTGSIGRQTLEIARMHPERYRPICLVAGKNIELLAHQIEEFGPEMVAVDSKEEAEFIAENFPDLEVGFGPDGLVEAAGYSPGTLVVNALSGITGLYPTIRAIECGCNIAIANKETIVAGGSLVTEAAEYAGVSLLPVDSEHSAIFQAIHADSVNLPKRIILTASGGPFRGKTREEMASISVEEALAHPNWKMGRKISIDSATLMNKGLEVIEACRLFNVSPSQIDVVVHPESIVHSAVEFADGSVIAQMGNPDMKVPIAYALSYPERLPTGTDPLNLTEAASLTFEKPDMDNFPCLRMAFEAAEKGGSHPIVLNSANEEAVGAFLEGRITFLDIERLVASALDTYEYREINSIEEVAETDAEVKAYVKSEIERI